MAGRVAEAEKEAHSAQLTLTEHVRSLGPGEGRTALSAALKPLLNKLQTIAVGLQAFLSSQHGSDCNPHSLHFSSVRQCLENLVRPLRDLQTCMKGF